MAKRKRRQRTRVTLAPEAPVVAAAYLDQNSCRIEILQASQDSSGLWGVYRTTPGGLRVSRLQAPSLPQTYARDKLEASLARYAQLRAWRPLTEPESQTVSKEAQRWEASL